MATVPKSFIFVLLALPIILSSFGQAAIVTVCASGCSQTTIQAGINAASNYDIINIVDGREYLENVTVNKTGITLTSNRTPGLIIVGLGSAQAIDVTSNNVIISNLTMKYNGSSAFVHTVYSAATISNLTIANNTVRNVGSNSGTAVRLDDASVSRIENNTIDTTSGSSNDGIFIAGDSNTIRFNVINTSGTSSNIALTVGGSSNTIASNNINAYGSSSGNYGVYLSAGSSNTITLNTITTNGTSGNHGIFFDVGTGSNILSSNVISANGTTTGTYGIYLYGSSGSSFSQDRITVQQGGSSNIAVRIIEGSNGNTFAGINATTTTAGSYGVYLSNSDGNIFADSFMTATQTYDAFLNGTGMGSNYFVNVSFNKSDVNATAANVKTKLFVKYRLDVTVTNGTIPLSGVLVFGNDTASQPNSENPTSNFSVLTNSSGQIQTQTLTEFLANGTYQNGNYIYFTNYTINASLTNYISSLATINLTQSSSLAFALVLKTVCIVESGQCFETIQEAINSASNGQVVVIIDSKEFNEEVFVNKSGMTLMSNSSLKPVVFSSGSLPPLNITSDNVTVRNLMIKYNGSSNDTASIYAKGRFNITIANNTVLALGSGSDYGIGINTTTFSVVENNTVYTNTSSANYGIYVSGSDSLSVRYNSINSSGSLDSNYGIYIRSSTASNVTSNTVWTNGTTQNFGIYVFGGSGHIIGNNSANSRSTTDISYGIYVDSSSTGNSIRYNIVTTSSNADSNYGIRLQSSSSNNITGNSVYTNGTSSNAAIYLGSSDSVRVEMNTLFPKGTSSSNYGILLFGSDNSQLIDNDIVTWGTSNNYGMRIYSGSLNNNVSISIITTNGTGGSNYGISIEDTSTGNTVYQNQINTNGTSSNYGIYILSSSTNTLTSNTISTSGTSSNFGIYLFSSSSSNTLSSNSITTSGTSSGNVGIYLESSSSSNTLSSNSITTNGTSSNYGIYLLSSSNSTLTVNTITTSGTSSSNYGIFLSNSSSNTFRSNNITTNTSLSNGVRIDVSNNNTFYDDRINATQAEDVFLVGTVSGNNNYFVNVSFNKSDITATNSAVQTKLFVQNRILVRVIDGSSNAVDQAGVNMTDNGTFSLANSMAAANLSTNSSGYAEVNLTDFMANGTYQAGTQNGFLYFGSYYFNASKSGYSTYTQAAVNESKTITLTLSGLNPPTTTTSGSSGGGGSGGGGGGSSTPTEAKQSILITTVKPNTEVKGTFTNALLDLREIAFSSKTEATNARIEVTQTAAKPATAADLTNTEKESYKTYAFVQVTHTNIVDADLTNVKLTFEINKSWLADRGYGKDQVSLQRHADGKWSKLPTRLLSEDTRKYKFEADSPGLSTFVISIAVPVSASAPSSSAAPSITEETTTTTIAGSKPEETTKGGSPFTLVFVVLILIIAGGAYAFKDKLKKKA